MNFEQLKTLKNLKNIETRTFHFIHQLVLDWILYQFVLLYSHIIHNFATKSTRRSFAPIPWKAFNVRQPQRKIDKFMYEWVCVCLCVKWDQIQYGSVNGWYQLTQSMEELWERRMLTDESIHFLSLSFPVHSMKNASRRFFYLLIYLFL